MAKKPQVYDAASIEALDGLDGVRLKPAMYLGSTDSVGVTHLAREVIDNSLDEAHEGFGKIITILFGKDSYITVKDDGRGIPTGVAAKNKGRDSLTLAATHLHAGSKLRTDGAAYQKGTRGTHGVGLAVANACSEHMQIWSHHSGSWVFQEFEKGKPARKTMEPIQVKSLPPEFKHLDNKKGTMVRFKPDLSVFSKGAKFDDKSLISWLQDISWLVNASFVIAFEDEKKQGMTIHRPDGLKGRLTFECEHIKAEALHDPYVLRESNVDLMIGWCTSDEQHIYSSVSTGSTRDHGTHIIGFQEAIRDCFEEYRKRGDDFTAASLMAGIVAVVNVSVQAPQFTGQEKARLATPEGRDIVYKAMMEGKKSFKDWLTKNKTFARELIDRANAIAGAMAKYKADAKLAAATKSESRGKSLLPEGHKACTSKDRDEIEVYICEGDSALGSGIKARDVKFQELYALTGKIPNLEKKGSKLKTNEPIIDLLKVIGYSGDDTDTRRVGKVIILTDADVDGPLGGEQMVEVVGCDRGMPIKDIYARTLSGIETKVWGRTASGQVMATRVTAASRTHHKMHLKVTLSDDTVIRMTPNHQQPIWSFYSGSTVGEKIAASELSTAHYLPRFNLKSSEPAFVAVSVSKIQKVEKPENFYCLTVPETGNFLLRAKAGGGDSVLTGNSHITALLLTFIQKVMPNLFDEGRIWMVDPVLFIYRDGDEVLRGQSRQDIERQVGKSFDPNKLMRLKGIGEVPWQVLRNMAFQPDTRRILQVTGAVTNEDKLTVVSLMGSDTTERKQLLGIA